jgi:hypothetical protein
MPEENEVVNPTESTPVEEEQAVQKPVEETTAQSAPAEGETPQEPETPSPEGVSEEGEVDERGVPYKNVAMEYRRKYTELESNLPNLIQQAIERAVPQAPATQQQPQYTEEQLIQFKNQTEDAQAKTWAELELRKLEDRKSEQRARKIFEENEKKRKFEQEQQLALGTVMRKYPILFNQDGSWNNNHPLTQKVGQLYNSRPVFKQDGFGLLGAADMAFADYALQQQPNLAKQTQKLKRQVKKLEKATLVEGGGQAVKPAAKDTYAAAKEQFVNSTNSSKARHQDALKDVTQEYLKKLGML